MEKQATHLAVTLELFNQIISVVRSLPDSQVHDLVESIKKDATGVNLSIDEDNEYSKE